ncbi:MAG: hypothetical protein SGPRY_008600 [Prymnesium sp.]
MAEAAEAGVRSALSLYFGSLHECDEQKFDAMWNPRALLLGLAPDGSVVCRDAHEFRKGVMARGTSTEYARFDEVLSVHVLDVTCASAKVHVALPAAPNSPSPTNEPTLYTDWLTLLYEPSLKSWRIISKVYSSTPLTPDGTPSIGAPITPQDFQEVASAIWDGYFAAGRACDDMAMSKVFHPYSRLTFMDGEGNLSETDSAGFCAMVKSRWSSPKHSPWAHMKDDPKARSEDTLVSIDFAGINVARVTLKIGYPPCLYHDVLLLLRVTKPINGRAGWWIVAKSSANVPFLTEYGRHI